MNRSLFILSDVSYKGGLEVLNALSTATAKIHGRLHIHGKEVRSAGFIVVDQSMSIYLDIPTERGQENASVVWSPQSDQAEMVLVIGAGESERRWADDAEGKIESKLTEIAVEIVVKAELEYREGKVRNYKWRVERKAELEEAVRKRRLEEERAERERREWLQQENRMLQEHISMFDRNAAPQRQSYEDALCEQRHNFFKYRNVRRY